MAKPLLTVVESVYHMLSSSHLPATHLAIRLGLFGIGVLLNIPDSLISGPAVIDFGTKRGAATAAGFVNGAGSLGAVIGGTAPGWISSVTGEGSDTWPTLFLGLAAALALAAALLIPKWNALPPTAPKAPDTTPAPPSASPA